MTNLTAKQRAVAKELASVAETYGGETFAWCMHYTYCYQVGSALGIKPEQRKAWEDACYTDEAYA